jgi:hypothetical protein
MLCGIVLIILGFVSFQTGWSMAYNYAKSHPNSIVLPQGNASNMSYLTYMDLAFPFVIVGGILALAGTIGFIERLLGD